MTLCNAYTDGGQTLSAVGLSFDTSLKVDTLFICVRCARRTVVEVLNCVSPEGPPPLTLVIQGGLFPQRKRIRVGTHERAT
eukprot:1313322-Pyramimonas_sp.AAC.1